MTFSNPLDHYLNNPCRGTIRNMFIGLTAPYCSLSHIPRFSLDKEEEEVGSNVSLSNTSIGCSSEEDFPELLHSWDSPKNTQRAPQAQRDLQAFRPRTANSSRISPHFSPMGLIQQGSLSTNMSYSIKGLGVAQSSPQAMFRPVIQPYTIPYDRGVKSGSSLRYLHASPFIEHIDITTVWKGLLLSDAERLLCLHRTLRDSLNDLLADALNDMHKELQQQCTGVLVKPLVNRRFTFDLNRLILSMNQTLELCGRLLEKDSTRDFMMVLPAYLISCNCLLGFEGDRVGDATVEICMQYCDPLTYTVPVGQVYNAAWIPDSLSFNEIREFQREGQELIIIPRYCGNAAFTANATRTNVQYFIESSQPWLSWDHNISGFRGQVPLYSEMGGRRMKEPGKVYGVPPDGSYETIKALRIEIKALMTAGCGSSIRLKRTIRARLTFKVIPWYAHDSACAPTDDLVRPFSFHYPKCESPTSSSRSSRPHGEDAHESPLSNIFYNGSNPSLSSRNSSASSTKRLPGATDLQSPVVLSRKRRAASGFEVSSPTKKHREKDTEAGSALEAKSSNEQGIPPRKNFTEEYTINEISQPKRAQREELCNPKSRISSETWTDNSPKPASSDHVSDSLGAKFCNLIKSRISGETWPSTSLKPASSDHVSDSLSEELCNLIKSRITSGKWTGNSPEPASSGNVLDSLGSATSRNSSILTEIIIENPDVDPRIRHEQAILWRILSLKEKAEKINEETMLNELRDMYAAMKISAIEGKEKEMAKLGLDDVLDDVFIANSSDVDNSADLSPQGTSEPLDGVGSG